MAQNNMDGTGHLMLVQRTPIIKALFGDLFDSEEPPVTGELREDRVAVSTDQLALPTWDRLRDRFNRILYPEDPIAEHPLSEIFACLIERYKITDSWFINEVAPAVDTFDEYDSLEFDQLVGLAFVIDDDHGLVSGSMELAFTCSKLRSGEFGGYGEFVSRDVYASSCSSFAVTEGQRLHKALTLGQADQVVDILTESAERLLNQIRSEPIRQDVRALLARRLANPPIV